MLFEATMLLIRFKTFGRLRPSFASTLKLMTLLVSSEGDFSVIIGCFHASGSGKFFGSSFIGEVLPTLFLLEPNNNNKITLYRDEKDNNNDHYNLSNIFYVNCVKRMDN